MSDRLQTGATPGETAETGQEERLRALFMAADPPVPVSAALRQRVAGVTARAEALTRQRVARRWTPLRIGLGLAAATGLALVYATLSPRWVAAQVLQRVEAAEKKVRSAHVVAWKIESDGSRVKRGESWYQDGRWRLFDATSGRVQVFTNGKLWSYEPKLNKVTVRSTDGPFGYNPSGFSLTAMKQDYARWGWRDEFRVLGDKTVNGRRVHQILIHRAGDTERSILKVDAETDLPIGGESQLRREGRWVTMGLSEHHEYNQPLSAALFEPRFPKSARVVDIDNGQETWKARLSKGIARQRIGGREIVIRDLQVNAQGDLFMLYTAGQRLEDLSAPGKMYRRDWEVEVKDERGTVYTGRSQIMTDSQVPPKYRTGWVFNGEQWEGDWWVSLHPQEPWRPRRILVTFRIPAANEQKPASGKEPASNRATFAIDLQRPECAVVPDYMTNLFDGVQEREVPIRRATARGFYYHHEQRDLPRALASYREVVRLRAEAEKESGEHVYDAQTWLNIGEVLRDMSRTAEARAAFEQAIREDISGNWARQQAEAEIEKLRGAEAWSVGQPAPGFTATDLDGKPQSPPQYRGQVLLIHFWGAWDDNNGAIHADLPLVNRLHARYSEKGLAVLGIAIHFERDKVDKLIRKERLAWPQVYDGLDWRSPLYRSFGAPRVPGSILIDRQGIIRAVGLRGEALEKAVAELVGTP
jgi:outer membrane lipoprotein-sorting protein/tetratricopeptide (TPR) repeat protein